jgi:hypothetical protein
MSNLQEVEYALVSYQLLNSITTKKDKPIPIPSLETIKFTKDKVKITTGTSFNSSEKTGGSEVNLVFYY